jgi:DNA primase
VQGILDDRQRTANVVQGIEFEDRELPEEFALIDADMPVHYQYLRDRCVPEDYPVGMIHGRPDDKFSRRQGVIIPFTYDGRIVGHTRRFFDDHNPRYVHDIQPGYVFGTDLQQPDWQHVIVMEGVFDALSIAGLAVLHADISDAQARLIRSLGREVTVVPDQDQSGMKLIDRAIELGWAVSMPAWPSDVKDVNDAVIRWGRAATLITILQARENSRIKIELRKKTVLKKIKEHATH